MWSWTSAGSNITYEAGDHVSFLMAPPYCMQDMSLLYIHISWKPAALLTA